MYMYNTIWKKNYIRKKMQSAIRKCDPERYTHIFLTNIYRAFLPSG